MKFAKKLSEEIQDRWSDKYIDYKLMKKVLKRADEDAVRFFCDLYEAQVRKVHQFMLQKQEEITAGICPLELELSEDAPTNVLEKSGKQDLSNHCEQLVEDIELFRDYTSLNIEGMRKIIKKFDKRFQMNFNEIFVKQPNGCSRRLLVSDQDICKWLLFPANQCLKLMRQVVDGSTHVDRPLRQFNFWVDELRAGAEIARQQFASKQMMDHTRLRLALACGREDLSFCIKNTFIDLRGENGEVQSPCSRRSSSEPRLRVVLQGKGLGEDVSEDEILRQMPVVNVEHFICESLDIEPPLRENSIPRSPSPTPVYAGIFGYLPQPRPPRASSPTQNNSTNDGPQKANSAPQLPTKPEGYFPTHARGRGMPQVPSGNFSSAPKKPAMDEFGPSCSSTYRWWTQANVSMTCPVSGFPINLLPYPPYKFRMRSEHTKEAPVLVDGPFLVLQVLSTWNFEVLGRPLVVADVASLDSYMKRCKLGPFRLGRAMELLATGTPESHRELASLRAEAMRKLENLRHIQTYRRGQAEQQPPQKNNQRKQEQKQANSMRGRGRQGA